MDENTVLEKPLVPVKAEASVSRWLTAWVILLCDVLLFASAVNCLFRWLSYGFNHDAAAFALSLILGLAVYFAAINARRLACPRNRLLLAVAAVLLWAALMPVVMRLTGFGGI